MGVSGNLRWWRGVAYGGSGHLYELDGNAEEGRGACVGESVKMKLQCEVGGFRLPRL